MTTTTTTPVTLDAVREFLDRQKNLADADLTEERARLSDRVATPDFDLGAVARAVGRLARLQGVADLWSYAVLSLAATHHPEEALYALAAYVAAPTAGTLYGSESAEAARADGVRGAASTALSALHALATAGRAS